MFLPFATNRYCLVIFLSFLVYYRTLPTEVGGGVESTVTSQTIARCATHFTSYDVMLRTLLSQNHKKNF